MLNLPTYAAPEGPTADRADTGTAMALVDQLDDYRPDEPVLFDISVLRFAEPYSGPVLAALARNGVDVVVEDDGMVRQLGERRRAVGRRARCDSSLLEGAAAEQPPEGARTVALVEGLERGRGEPSSPRCRPRWSSWPVRAGWSCPTQGGTPCGRVASTSTTSSSPSAATPDRSRPAASWPPW